MVKDLKKKLRIKLVVLNNESDETKAKSLAQDMILRNKVKFIVNGMDPPHMRAPIAAACEQYKVIHITGCGPYEAWMGLRKSVPKPWQYTWRQALRSPHLPNQGIFEPEKWDIR